jgi:hypothetical protein
MKKWILTLVIVILPFLMMEGGEGVPAWEKHKTRKGITTFTRPVEGIPYDEFFGRGRIDASLQVIRSIMMNVEKYSRWMNACIESKRLPGGDRDTFYYYLQSKSPWPVSNRDGIYRCDVKETENRLVFRVQALKNSNLVPERGGVVRMENVLARWTFTRTGDSVIGSYYLRSDPGGDLPVTLYNASGPDLPYKNLIRLREEVQRVTSQH